MEDVFSLDDIAPANRHDRKGREMALHGGNAREVVSAVLRRAWRWKEIGSLTRPLVLPGQPTYGNHRGRRGHDDAVCC